MSSARRTAVLPLALAIGGVLVATTPAFATVRATWSKPTDNSTFTGTAPIELIVTLDRGSTLTADGAAAYLNLAVPGPTPGPHRVDTSSGTSDRELKFTFTPACPNHAGTCASGAAPAYNGRYTVSLSGSVTGSRTIVLQVPPAAPSGVSAVATGQRRVKVSWDANREPDLTGYDLFNEQGAIVAANLPADRTSHEFDLPSTGYGGEHTYYVRASRLACSNCSGPGSDATLTSSMSSASVTLTEPTPEPEPGDGGYNGGTGTGTGTGGGDTGSGSGGTGSGGGYNGGTGTGSGTGSGNNGNGNGGSGTGTGTTDGNGYNTGTGAGGGRFSSGTGDTETRAAQQRLAFSLNFKSFAPKLGAPKLPPLPKFAAPTEEALPWGTYDPTLNYGDQQGVESETVATGGGITTTLVDTFTTVFEGRRLYSSIAGALLLLLAAAHLRVWLRHSSPVV